MGWLRSPEHRISDSISTWRSQSNLARWTNNHNMIGMDRKMVPGLGLLVVEVDGLACPGERTSAGSTICRINEIDGCLFVI